MSACKVHNVKFYKLKPKGVNCMSCNKKEKKLALSRSEATIEIWNLTHTPHIEKTIPSLPHGSIEALTWYKNRLFSVGLTNELIEYDLKSLKPKYAVPITGGAGWCMDIHVKTKKIVIGTESGYVNLFSITEEGVEYEKVFDKQDGRILCLKFEKSGKFIASGSADTVRIWNVETGHAIHKMNIVRLHTKTETVVWDLVITDDFTIITGDSRGYITFWDGNMGAQIESYQSHIASVLTLCLSDNQKTLYCAGVDPLIVSYEKICVKEDSMKWVKSVQRKIHDHDVRNLVLLDDRLYSAGIDGYLSCSYYPPRTLVKYPPLLQGQVVFVAKENKYVMLRHHNYLEIWQLGKESSEEGNEGFLQLEDEPKKLVLLQSKDEEFINCAGMSNNGQWIFYSTSEKIRLFNFSYSEDTPNLTKISSLPDECTNCINAIFSQDGSHLAMVSQDGELFIFHLTGEQIFLVQKISTQKYLHDTITFLKFSPCGKYIILADPMSNIAIWRKTDTWKYHCSLPKYKSSPTALEVQPDTNNLLVVYADHKIIEYDMKLRKFTDFSKGLDERHPRQWLNRSLPVMNISYDPRAENIIFLHDDYNICVINKEKKLPKANTKIPKIDSSSSNQEDSLSARTNEHAFHIIKKNKHLVYFGRIDEGEMISVEINPLSLYECLPPCLDKKVFGTK